MAATVGALEHLDVYENPSRFVVVGRRRVDGGAERGGEGRRKRFLLLVIMFLQKIW